MPNGATSVPVPVAVAAHGQRGLFRPREHARTLGLFYAIGCTVTLGSIAVGGWPGADWPRIVAVAVAGLATAGVLWLTGDRTSRPLLSLLLSIGILMTTTVQLASGSARAAAAYGVFHVLTVAYVVLSAGAVEIVGQVTLVVITQIFVARQMGTFGPGDTRGLAALIFVNVASGVGVGLVLFQHVHGRRKAEHYASAQSGLDALTGLANRPALLQQVDRFLRANVVPPALLLVDLAGFRDINDTFGVEVGDQLLRAVAERLTSTIRAEDVLARIGGDEFAVLLTDGSRTPIDARAAQAAQRLHSALREPFELEGIALSIEVRIGIAIGAAGVTAEDLLRQADLATDRARDDVRSTATVTDIPPRRSPDRLELLAEVRRSLRQGPSSGSGTLVPYFQPKIALASGCVTGAEALVRWLHPARGLVAPATFLPLLERTSLMRELTDHMLARSLSACASWHRSGMALSVSVNVSARDLNDPGLVQAIAAELARTQLPASALTIEITETALMNDLAQASAVVHQLRALGVGVSVDDFGTGWSSLAHLQRLPVTELKVDRSFVMASRTDAGAAKIVAATIGLGQSLGLAAVAEGVEDAETLAWLTELGCDLAQGWHLGRPMPAVDFVDFAGQALGADEAAHRQRKDSDRADSITSGPATTSGPPAKNH
jgi:diguanylate cyclase (GGDEF)-like protein